jgi:hypothetical protein
VPRPAVVVEPADGLPASPVDVVRAVAHLAGRRRLTVLAGRWSGTRFLLTADPVEVVERTGDDLPDAEGLAALLDRAGLPPTGSVPGAVGGGWSVVLGHALGRVTGRVRTSPPPQVGPRLPDLVLARHPHLLRHDGSRWWAEALDEGDGAALQRARDLAAEVRRACAARTGAQGLPGAAPPPAWRVPRTPPATWRRWNGW